jgi:heavy metal translocating P-type ATPase
MTSAVAHATAGRSAPGVTRDRRRAARWLIEHRAQLLAAVAVTAIAAGGILHLAGAEAAGHQVWRAAVALLAVELTFEVARTVVVDHHLGVDTIALVAMVGALALDEELAGAVIGLMFSGGAALEAAASHRARRELTRLVERAPRVAQLRVDDTLKEVPVDVVDAGDVVLVRTGEVIPVDGTVVSPEAVVDTSTLSGEPLPVTLRCGMPVMSGTANAGTPFDVRADRPAAESAYAALVRLVEQAQAQRAPLVRMADRYAGIFLPVTLAVAGLAWALSGDPVRALAVVVVATPCPLILAAPIALVSGLSRAARNGVIVKGAGAIETLGEARTVLFDKTGTLTVGTPDVQDVIALGDHTRPDILRLAASVDRLSAHVLGEALVRSAREAELDLEMPTDVREEPGQGIAGSIDGNRVAVGSRAFLRAEGYDVAEVAGAALATGHGSGEAHVLVGIDDTVAGVIVMADELRPDADRIVERLRAEGVRHVAMVSGDRQSVADRIGRALGVDRVYAEQSPEDKLEVVRSLRADPALRPVIMVGDGVNDAPALALADLGIAMGAGGATVSSETADAVITVDRVDRVADAVHTGRRSLFIARQSVLAGMGLSIAAMGVAAVGYLPPVAGALFQEVIDLAVILNALRALRG